MPSPAFQRMDARLLTGGKRRSAALGFAAGLMLLVGACALTPVSSGWTPLHPVLPTSTETGGGWLVGADAPNPAIALPLSDVANRWVRFSGWVGDIDSEPQYVVNVFNGSKIVTRGVPSRCDTSTSRCTTLIWIPPEATRVVAVVWARVRPVEVRDMTIEVARSRSIAREDGDRIESLLATLHDSFYRSDEVDWAVLGRHVHSMGAPPAGTDPLPAIAQAVRDRLPGNGHMFVMPRALMQTATTTVSMPQCTDLDHGIGLATVPRISASEGEGPLRYASTLTDCFVKSPADRSWVIDLRGNGGGNMYPMISGVAPLLPAGSLYAFVDGHGRPTSEVAIGASGVTSGGRTPLPIPTPEVGTRSQAAVVVVYDASCASACEQVANALAARPRTLFVGEDSAGFTSANFPLRLNDDYTLAVTGGYTADPCGHPISTRLHPDVVVERVGQSHVADLLKLDAVTAWLETTRQRGKQPLIDEERRARC